MKGAQEPRGCNQMGKKWVGEGQGKAKQVPGSEPQSFWREVPKCQGPGAGGRVRQGVQSHHPASTEKETSALWQREGKSRKGEETRSPLL